WSSDLASDVMKAFPAPRAGPKSGGEAPGPAPRAGPKSGGEAPGPAHHAGPTSGGEAPGPAHRAGPTSGDKAPGSPPAPPQTDSAATRDVQDTGQAGIVMLMACEDVQLSEEDAILRNGVFSFYVIEALRRRAADSDGNGHVSGEEVFAYAYPLVVAWNPDQTPELYDTHAGELDVITAADRPLDRIVTEKEFPFGGDGCSKGDGGAMPWGGILEGERPRRWPWPSSFCRDAAEAMPSAKRSAGSASGPGSCRHSPNGRRPTRAGPRSASRTEALSRGTESSSSSAAERPSSTETGTTSRQRSCA
ncbi:MAG: hypothetical protein ACYS9X_22610, partial [Planctomycetota bacterium]